MKVYNIFFLFSLLLFANILLFAQNKTRESAISSNNEYYNPDFFRYDNYAYSEKIKSVQLFPTGNELGIATINLGSSEQLHLHFDEMEHHFTQYSFTIVRCTWNWFPLDMPPLEYINGYTEDFIYDYSFSVNTNIAYTHYELKFPSENMQLKLSGNYVLIVYEKSKENPIITRRFTVSEQLADLKINIHQATIVEHMNYKQEIDFTLFLGSMNITDPYNELKVVIKQNNRTDNQVTELKPTFVKGNELIYDQERLNLFWGNNEFRDLNITNLRNYYDYTEKISLDDSDIYHVFLKPQTSRSFLKYTNKPDINGNFVVNRENALRDKNSEADYVYVHFILKNDFPIANGQAYLMGSLSDWQIKDEFKMNYNYPLQQYECTALLKQGYYNYMFAVLEDNKKEFDFTYFEGSHWQTQNQYQIDVYYVPNFNKERYRLIASKNELAN
jgi:hypothetical protein